MRPIDADALKKSIEEDEKLKDNTLVYLLMNLMTCYIDDAPTIDVEPVKNGHWIDGTCGAYKICSVCDQISDFDFDYCPYCGAMMDEIMNDE